MRNLASAVVTAQAAQSRKPVILVEIELSDSVTLRYARARKNISFGGNTYYARAIEFGDVKHTIEGGVGELSIDLDNTDKTLNDYFIYYDFYNKTMTVKRIYLDSNGQPPSSSSEYVEYFYGYISEVSEVNYTQFSMKGILSYDLKNKALLASYSMCCRHVFGDDQCNQDGNADLTSLTKTSTATGGSACTLVDTVFLAEITGYWTYGKIEVTINGRTYKRIIINYSLLTQTITFDYPVPTAVSNGDSYQIWKGCKKDWGTCTDIYPWGPSADNSDNFGGFIHINVERDN